MTRYDERADQEPRRLDSACGTDMKALLHETGLGCEFDLEALLDRIERAEAGR